MDGLDSEGRRFRGLLDALVVRDEAGSAWLDELLAAFRRADGTAMPVPAAGAVERARWTGYLSRRTPLELPAPRALLELLAGDASRLRGDRPLTGRAETVRLRAALLAGDRRVRERALAALRAPKRPTTGWFVFEAPLAPDAYIETDALILVLVAGRPDEPPLRSTPWLEGRDALLRAMDAADAAVRDAGRSLPVLGGYLLDDDGSGAVPAGWHALADATVLPATLAASLPHRAEPDRARLAAGYLGVASVTAVARATGVVVDAAEPEDASEP